MMLLRGGARALSRLASVSSSSSSSSSSLAPPAQLLLPLLRARRWPGAPAPALTSWAEAPASPWRRAPLGAPPPAGAGLSLDLDLDGDGGGAGASVVGDEAPPLSAPRVEAMNRNAREPRKSNHGARPCSSVRRRRKIKRRANDHPFIPLHRSRRLKGYDI
jgi:hypothetical protein